MARHNKVGAKNDSIVKRKNLNGYNFKSIYNFWKSRLSFAEATGLRATHKNVKLNLKITHPVVAKDTQALVIKSATLKSSISILSVKPLIGSNR